MLAKWTINWARNPEIVTEETTGFAGEVGGGVKLRKESYDFRAVILILKNCPMGEGGSMCLMILASLEDCRAGRKGGHEKAMPDHPRLHHLMRHRSPGCRMRPLTDRPIHSHRRRPQFRAADLRGPPPHCPVPSESTEWADPALLPGQLCLHLEQQSPPRSLWQQSSFSALYTILTSTLNPCVRAAGFEIRIRAELYQDTLVSA
jgi:hypothetical protein